MEASITGAVRVSGNRGAAPPVYGYRAAPGAPHIGVLRLDRAAAEGVGAHVHDFPGLVYFEQDGGSLLMRAARRNWPVRAGDLFVIAPGELVEAVGPVHLEGAGGWGIFFTADALGVAASEALLAWRAHPLLAPFAGGSGRGTLRLQVARTDQPQWSARIRALDDELRRRRLAYHQAALAHLSMLLVDVARLAEDRGAAMQVNAEPLLADVFTIIEERFHQTLSLRDVADQVHLTPGYLTTVVRRRTGRTVQDWITERRMTKARRLLIETDLSVAEIAAAVGLPDPRYFTRRFKHANGTTPLQWRRAARGHAG